MYQKKILLAAIVFFVSGCSIPSVEDKKIEIFIPNQHIEEKAEVTPTPTPEPIPTPSEILQMGDEIFFQIDHQINTPKTREFFLYSDTKKSCDTLQTSCWIEIWDTTQKKSENGGKIFTNTFSATTSTVSWLDENTLLLKKISPRQETTSTFLSSLDIYSGKVSEQWRKKTWNTSDPLEKNTITTVKINGTTYFFDTISSTKQITIYKILDTFEEFYVRSSGVKNLQKIQSIPVSTVEKIKIADNPKGIEFTGQKNTYFFNPTTQKISLYTQ